MRPPPCHSCGLWQTGTVVLAPAVALGLHVKLGPALLEAVGVVGILPCPASDGGCMCRLRCGLAPTAAAAAIESQDGGGVTQDVPAAFADQRTGTHSAVVVSRMSGYVDVRRRLFSCCPHAQSTSLVRRHSHCRCVLGVCSVAAVSATPVRAAGL